MDYSPEAFAALYEDVERQGGALLPETCEPQDAMYDDPPYSHGRGEQKRVTCGCYNDSRFVIRYNLPEGREGADVKKRGGGFVTACAVCDNVGAWPRHEKAVYAADPDMDPCAGEEPPEEPQG